MMNTTEAVDIKYSSGRVRSGRRFAYIRPSFACLNRPMRVSGNDRQNLVVNVEKAIRKYYTPIFTYEIQGKIVGSNNPANALKEFYRVCEKEQIGRKFEVTLKV